jgi:hypothetical protein
MLFDSKCELCSLWDIPRMFLVPSARSEQQDVILCFEIFDQPPAFCCDEAYVFLFRAGHEIHAFLAKTWQIAGVLLNTIDSASVAAGQSTHNRLNADNPKHSGDPCHILGHVCVHEIQACDSIMCANVRLVKTKRQSDLASRTKRFNHRGEFELRARLRLDDLTLFPELKIAVNAGSLLRCWEARAMALDSSPAEYF